MGTKYLRTMADSAYSEKKRKHAYRGLCITVRKYSPPMETGLCLTASLATAALIIVLFAIWFFAG